MSPNWISFLTGLAATLGTMLPLILKYMSEREKTRNEYSVIIQQQAKQINDEATSLRAELRKEIDSLKEEIEQLKEDNFKLEAENIELRQRVSTLETDLREKKSLINHLEKELKKKA